MEKKITAPFTQETARTLKSGERILLSGTIYTARDAAHKRMSEEYEKTGKLPIDLKNQVIYYAGPCPAKPGMVIGSCGPTTAGRMDAYTPLIISCGLTGMIGKGGRTTEVVEQMKHFGTVYLGACGGAGALIAECIKSSEIVAYDDLGTEAIRRLEVSELPLIVLIDCEGNNIYETGIRNYCKSI